MINNTVEAAFKGGFYFIRKYLLTLKHQQTNLFIELGTLQIQ